MLLNKECAIFLHICGKFDEIAVFIENKCENSCKYEIFVLPLYPI